MVVSTLRPNGVAYSSSWVNEAGGAVTSAKVSDDLDTTYVRATHGYPESIARVNFDMGTVTPTATQRILRCRVNARCAHEGTCIGWYEKVSADLKDITSKGVVCKPRDFFQAKNPTTPKKYTGAWRPTNPDGREWTKKMIDSIQAEFYGYLCASGSLTFMRVYEVYVDVDIRDQPTVSGVTVSNNTTSSRPQVDFTYNPNADGDVQVAYRVKFFTSAQYNAAGFDPATSPSAWDSGIVTSQATSVVPTKDLINGVTYKAYVEAAQDFNGSRWWSAWVASSPFTEGYAPVPKPAFAVTPDNTLPNVRNLIQADARLNLLSGDDASFESTIGTWVASVNCAVIQSATQALNGAQSLRLTSSAGGDMTARTAVFPTAYGASQNQPYLVTGFYRAAVSARSCRMRISWLDVFGVQIGSTVAGPSVTDSTTGWTQAPMFAVSPVGTRYVTILADVLATGAAAEQHFLDEVMIVPLTLGNLLTANQASAESSVDPLGLASKVNCTAGRTTQAFLDGAASLGVTGSGAGDMKAGTADAYRIPIIPGLTYTGRFASKAAATPRAAHAELLFYDALSAGSIVATITGGDVNDAAAAFTEPIFATGVAPANAVACELRLVWKSVVLNETHYADKMSLTAAADAGWQPGISWFAGGMAGLDNTLIEYNDWVTQAARVINVLNPQIATAGELTSGTDGFYARFSNDILALDHQQLDMPGVGESVLAWTVVASAFSFLDIGAPQGSYEPTYSFPCAPGLQVTFSAWVKAKSGTHSCKLFIFPIDQSGAQVGIGTESNSGAQTVDTTWRRLQCTVTPPAGSVGLRGGLENSNGDLTTYYFDSLQLEVGAAATDWHQGQGQIPAWQSVRNAKSSLVTDLTTNLGYVFDREAPPGVIRTYRATTIITFSDGTMIASDPSLYTQTRLNLLGRGNYVLKDPFNPAMDLTVDVTDINGQIIEDQDVLHPVRPSAVQGFGQRPQVNTDWIGGDDETVTVVTTTERDWYVLRQLIRTQHALVLQYPHGGQKYIRFTSRAVQLIARTDTGCVSEDVYRRVVTLPFLEVDRPVVLA